MNSICKTDQDGDKYWVIPNTENHRLSYKGLGVLHKEDGPAIECINGSKFWFINGLRHRENGPAAEYISGTKHWYINNKVHREDGPACEWPSNIIKWYLNHKAITPTNEMMEKYIKSNPDNISKYYKYPLEIQLFAISLKPNVIFNIKYPHEKLKELYPQLYALKNSGLI